MVFERLQHLKSKADRVLLYPSKMLDPLARGETTEDATLLIRARDVYGVKLVPITIQHRQGSDPTWADSFTKLLAFNQTQYNRVLSIDSDATLLQNIDELFLSPPATVAVPRAYWLYPEKKIVASHIMLVQPSVAEFARIVAKVEHAEREEYDMEIINDLYKDSAMILPHRPYALLTRSFGGDHQDYYLGNDNEVWNPAAVYREAKYLHFSDWPMHKPWLKSPDSLIKESQPDCVIRNGTEDCTGREIWYSFYTDFRARRAGYLTEGPSEAGAENRAGIRAPLQSYIRATST
ncbi:glucose N-acetyltransferase [Colletotrichum orchidophilum]|uniref:Glucose N-acetyltransferase n=1 Tax=Colletotrichum orchidophilum TaxID=1209926 RepID=A0A1G4AV73_9PEZI|nr:glucose N-acetyltransferase [Colletotrichum orchidophilum]OHE93069.1 glucose N-acetyltransferase [Colletotrichum orchidophilum]